MKRIAAGAVLPFLLALSGCGGDPAPAARLAAVPAEIRLAPSRCVTVRLEWTPRRALDRLHGRPAVFVHLLDRVQRPFRVLRTFDHPLVFEWKAGRPILDEMPVCQSALAPALAPGRYALTAGLNDDSWGYRWPLEVEGMRVARREYRIATVEATAERSGTPEFAFSGPWSATRPGTDSQVLARRDLSGKGTLAVRNASAGGAVRMAWDGRGVAIESDCSPNFAQTLGPGFQWIRVPVAPPPAGACEIRVSAPAAAPLPTASLAILGWEQTTP